MNKSQLLCCRIGDLYTRLCHIPGLVRFNLKPQILGVHDNKTVASISCIYLKRPQSFHFQVCIKLMNKRRHIVHGHPFHFSVPAVSHRPDQPARCFQGQNSFWFLHGQNACLQKHCGYAYGVRPGHWRGIFRLHDDPAHLGIRVLGRYQKVYMTENPTSRFIKHKIAQCIVPGDPSGLLP